MQQNFLKKLMVIRLLQKLRACFRARMFIATYVTSVVLPLPVYPSDEA
jgi:hypothetical protein